MSHTKTSIGYETHTDALVEGKVFGEVFDKMKMARLARFERATYGLEVRCSIQLSYRRIDRMRYLADIGPFVHKKASKR